jgi:hypothetical protein
MTNPKIARELKDIEERASKERDAIFEKAKISVRELKDLYDGKEPLKLELHNLTIMREVIEKFVDGLPCTEADKADFLQSYKLATSEKNPAK